MRTPISATMETIYRLIADHSNLPQNKQTNKTTNSSIPYLNTPCLVYIRYMLLRNKAVLHIQYRYTPISYSQKIHEVLFMPYCENMEHSLSLNTCSPAGSSCIKLTESLSWLVEAWQCATDHQVRTVCCMSRFLRPVITNGSYKGKDAVWIVWQKPRVYSQVVKWDFWLNIPNIPYCCIIIELCFLL